MEKMPDEWEILRAEAEEEIKKTVAEGKKAPRLRVVPKIYLSWESRKAQEARRAANKCGKGFWGMPPSSKQTHPPG